MDHLDLGHQHHLGCLADHGHQSAHKDLLDHMDLEVPLDQECLVAQEDRKDPVDHSVLLFQPDQEDHKGPAPQLDHKGLVDHLDLEAQPDQEDHRDQADQQHQHHLGCPAHHHDQ